jgi:hypothetical protein
MCRDDTDWLQFIMRNVIVEFCHCTIHGEVRYCQELITAVALCFEVNIIVSYR